MNPPSTPIAFESVPTWTSTRPWSPQWSTVPEPPAPSTPEARAPPRPRVSPSAVDARGVVQPVAYDHALLVQDRGDRSGVRREARLEHQGLLGVLEVCEATLELAMHRTRPGDGAGRPGDGPALRGAP